MSSTTMSGPSSGVQRNEKREGQVARMIEDYTTEIPSDAFLWAAGGSIVGSIFLHVTGNAKAGLFVGQWAPTFLILGLYNKIVKLQGSD
jgi:hypothetical protein